MHPDSEWQLSTDYNLSNPSLKIRGLRPTSETEEIYVYAQGNSVNQASSSTFPAGPSSYQQPQNFPSVPGMRAPVWSPTFAPGMAPIPEQGSSLAPLGQSYSRGSLALARNDYNTPATARGGVQEQPYELSSTPRQYDDSRREGDQQQDHDEDPDIYNL